MHQLLTAEQVCAPANIRLVKDIVQMVLSPRKDNACEKQDIDDIVQNALFQAIKNIHRFNGDSEFETWIHRIAVNCCFEYLRQKKAHVIFSLDDPAFGLANKIADLRPSANPYKVLVCIRARRAVTSAFRKLSKKQKGVLRMRFEKDMSFKEIATKMGSSTQTMKDVLYRAKLRLQTYVLVQDLP